MIAQAAAAAARWVTVDAIQALGAGHIHDTYLVSSGSLRYVLQRINTDVFTNPDLLMAQTRRVLAQWGKQTDYRVPELIQTPDGADWLQLDGCWRLWRYLEDTAVVDPLQNADQMRAAGRAFGRFQAQMADLPGPRLQDSIAGFLQLELYLRGYSAVADRAPVAERMLVAEHVNLAAALSERNACIHGDCKVNNLLFDGTGEEVAAIIDFDTVMYGHWAWDFGDLVRSVSFSRGQVTCADFAACLAGFAAERANLDVEQAVIAPRYVALMLGVRFLTDHLSGDHYFRVSRPGENLHRAQEQFELLRSFVRQADDFRAAARDVVRHRAH